jgi:hypothetical protein
VPCKQPIPVFLQPLGSGLELGVERLEVYTRRVQ